MRQVSGAAKPEPGFLTCLRPATWMRWAKWVAAALALVLVSTEEIVKCFLHHPEMEHVEAVLPALALPTVDAPPPGQQMFVVPRWYEEQHRQAVFAATSMLYRRNAAIYADVEGLDARIV